MKDYIELAKKADDIAESVVRECGIQRTKGNTIAVNYTMLYPAIFLEIYHDMLQDSTVGAVDNLKA